MDEAVFRDLFAAQMRAHAEVRVPFGRVDIFIDRSPDELVAVEVEPFKRWREGIRQALAYAAQFRPRRDAAGVEIRVRPGLAVFGQMDRDESLAIYLKTRDHVALWLFDELEWEKITNRIAARRTHRHRSRSELEARLGALRAENLDSLGWSKGARLGFARGIV